MYGVTEGAVYQRLKADGLATERKTSHKDLIPWIVKVEHAHAHPALMLRVLSRRRQGLENSTPRNNMLDRWLDGLSEHDLVVMYDPDARPNEASPVSGGWFYAPRRKSDGDSLIRYAKPGKALPKALAPRM